MVDEPIRFDDGAAYEQMMGVWSRLAGQVFLDWVHPPMGLVWADIGCGNGAFTELVVERCAPLAVMGIDPSDGQLSYARGRHKAGVATFVQGDAMALPFETGSADIAVMALVIFFVPQPEKGVAEMKRVVRPGGIVSAYAWDMLRDGFPIYPMQAALREMGQEPRMPPRADISPIAELAKLWNGAGLQRVETREITVERPFENFEAYWESLAQGPSLKLLVTNMPAEKQAELKRRTAAQVPRNAAGQMVFRARANAVKGIVPA
jgi:ubiquinone/menaquinone biosynthesis C-methylase UbiE